LQLKDYWFAEFSWRTVEVEPESGAVEDVLPRVNVTVFQEKDGDDYLVQLQIRLTPRQALKGGLPYEFTIDLRGHFEFVGDIPVEVRQRMIHVNGSMILYGFARGVLAEATSQGEYGKYILPAVNLLELLDKRGSLKGTEAPAFP